jgi:FKBP-type peptidyl-prolyl cis-trans isomerase SlyD
MQPQKIIVVLACWIVLGTSLGTLARAQETSPAVSPGAQVSIEYTLKLDDKNVVDSNVGGEPLVYVQGSRQIVPGLEKALEGMKVGDSKQVTVEPEEGYGVVHKEAFMEIEKDKIPDTAREVGSRVQGRTGDGKTVSARVAEIKGDTVVLDFNHPLAGKTLHFDVKIVKVEAGAKP